MDQIERLRLHSELDRIIDERIALEEANSIGLGGGFITPYAPITPLRARNALKDGVALAAEALGYPVRKLALGGKFERAEQQRSVLTLWLHLVEPLLYAPPSLLDSLKGVQTLSLLDVIDALSALDAGEVMPIFQAKTGRNRRKNHWSLAKAKLDALMWKKRLRALGHHEKDANFQITLAFGEQWDTVRRWEAQCKKTLGDSTVRSSLSFAGTEADAFFKQPSGIFGAVTRLDPLTALQAAGTRYQNEKRRAAELSPRKGKRSADE